MQIFCTYFMNQIANMKLPKTLSAIFTIVLFISTLHFTAGCSKDNDDTTPINTNDSIVVTMDPANWDCFLVGTEKYILPTTGKFEFSTEGVKGYGESSRLGCFLITTRSYELNNRTIYLKWKGNDGGAFVNYISAIVYNAFVSIGNVKSYSADLNSCSSPTVFNGSVVVSNNQWYYTTIKVANNAFSTTTATGAYGDRGGVVIENRNGSISNSHGKISLRNGDAYAGNASFIVINELKIK
jgi:hypothetical protein